jgi:hypothetical protein
MGQVTVPEVFVCHLLDFDDQSPNVDITWQVVNGSPVCREVCIRAVDTDKEVRCSGLAGVRIEDLLEKTIKALLWTHDLRRTDHPEEWIFPSGVAEADAVRQVRRARAGRKVKITDQLLQEVADIYRANVDRNPTAAVADHFDREPRTARLYVQRARKAGFLGEAIKGKAGEQ